MAPDNPPDKPTTPADLVQYQEGAIVSTTLLKGKGGTVTLFAFDAGESLSEHETPHDALLHVVDGAAVVTVAGTPHTVDSGRVLRLPANVPHAVQARQRFKMLLTMIRSGGA